jgi:DNA helicase II / ATP-dependent DNA helicase PcrA
MKYEQGLDDEQRAAVEAPERAIAVLAGPGSGKTRVLSYRARFLLLRDKNANCLLLTFTNKAASEMKSRAIAVNPVISKRIRAGTFHNFALSVLRNHGPHVGIQADFDVLDEGERAELAARAAQTAGTVDHGNSWSTQRLRLQLATAEVAKFGAAFEAIKRSEGVVDFDDLIVNAVRLFREKPDIARAYAANYQHILIDEFQDTNAAQFALVRALTEHAAPASTIGVFADDDQAIFGFAGAEAKNIARFCDELQAKTYPLTTNYRCAAAIVSVANRLIRANRANGRHMKSARPAGNVVVRDYDNADQEAVAVCTEIEGLIASGTDPQRISILVRSANRAAAIRATLAARHIPFSNWLGASYNAAESRLVRLCLTVARPVLTAHL